MTKRLSILVMASIVLTGMFFLPATLAAASSDGYWKFSRVKIEKNETREKTNWGVHNRYATGGSSSATYHYEGDWRQGSYRFQVQFTYGGIPAVLLPGQEYTIPISAKVSQNIKPKDEIKLLLGAIMYINHTRRSQESIESLSCRSLEYDTVGSVSVTLNHSKSDKLSDSATAEFIPPSCTKGREEYAVQINTSGWYYTCIYKWQPGSPTDEEKESVIPADNDVRPPWPDGAVAVVLGIRGDVSVDKNGSFEPVKQGTYLFPGDGIQTAKNNYSSVELVLRNPDRMVRIPRGTYFALEKKPDSIENIDQWVEKHGMGLISLIVGKIWLKATRGEEAVRFMTTASAIAGVRGTTFSVEVKENGSEQFSCYTGEVFVEPTNTGLHPVEKKREVTIKAGKAINFAPRGQMIGVRDLTDEEMSIGWILGRPDITQTEVPPEEKKGKLVDEQEKDDWRLEVYEQSNHRHGILIYDGLPIGEVGRDQLVSPFGILKYHGPYDAGKSSGWLLEDGAVTTPPVAPTTEPPSQPEAHAPNFNEHIILVKSVFSADEEIEVRWRDLPGGTSTKGDWITIVPASASEDTWGKWWYTGGKQSGTHKADKLSPGEYEVRVYFDWPKGGYTVHSRLPFTVR